MSAASKFACKVAGKVREIREDNNITQERLAKDCEVNTKTIGRIERGERDVTVGLLKKIADALGEDIKKFLV